MKKSTQNQRVKEDSSDEESNRPQAFKMVNQISTEDNALRTSADLKECLSFLRSMVNHGIEIKLWENNAIRKVAGMAIH